MLHQIFGSYVLNSSGAQMELINCEKKAHSTFSLQPSVRSDHKNTWLEGVVSNLEDAWLLFVMSQWTDFQTVCPKHRLWAKWSDKVFHWGSPGLPD